MNPWLSDMPWGLLTVLAVLLGLLLALTDHLARCSGRLAGLREADKRNRQQERFDYQRGKIDTIRDVTCWLRASGQTRAASKLPDALLTVPSSAGRRTPEQQ